MCQTVKTDELSHSMALIPQLYGMHGPFSDLNRSPRSESECDDECTAEWLDEAANMSDRVFTPSDSFIFPSYLRTPPSFILTVKSLNL